MADRPRLRAVLALSAAITCIASSFLLLPASGSVRPWKGARLIAVDSGKPEEAVLDSLSKQGLRNIVSRKSQTVFFSDFDEWGSVSLSDLEARLLPEDPRRDSYITGLEGYFSASSGKRAYNLLYLLDPGISRSSLERRLGKALGPGGDWLLVESGAKSSALGGIIAWLVLVMVLIALTPRGIRIACASIGAWIGIFLSSSWIFMLACLPAGMLAYCLFASVWKYPYEKRYTIGFLIRLVKNDIGLLPLICLALFSLLGFILFPASYAFALAASASIFAGASLREADKAATAFHPRFMPLPLRKGRPVSYGRKTIAKAVPIFSVAAALLAAAAAFLPSYRGASRDWNGLLSFPYPHGYTDRTGTSATYPNYRDYLDHLEHQASFLEADLEEPESPRAFAGFSRKADGSLFQTSATAARLDLSQGRGRTGMESILLQAGERARIVMDSWDGRGSTASSTAWAVPFLIAGMALGVASFYAKRMPGRMREAGARIDAEPAGAGSGRRKGAQ